MATIEQRVAAIEKHLGIDPELTEYEPVNPNTPIKGGKHDGKRRDWVIDNDPGYVVYLASLGPGVLAKWGFTDEDLDEAKQTLVDHPELDQKRTRSYR